MIGVAAIFLGQSTAPTPTPKPASTAAPAAHPTAAATTAASDLPKCVDCHEAQVRRTRGNPPAASHGPTAPDREEACSTCHGDGTEHIEGGGDITKITTFHGLEGAENCLSCHSKSNPHGSFAFGFHANSAAVNCLSCHSIHATGPRGEHLLAKDTGPLCQTCHTGISASFRNKPYTHRLDP